MAERVLLRDVQVANVPGSMPLAWQRDLSDRRVANAPVGDEKIGSRRVGPPPARSLESTRESPGFVLVAPFSLLRKLSDRLHEEERRLGRSCCLPLPIGPVPADIDRAFFALPHAVLQLTEGPAKGNWEIPILPNETILGHTTLAEPLQGIAAYIARAEELPKPDFDAEARERIAEALADALLTEEKVK